ncbi:MAG: tRNA sulfurtransferase [Candidatus Omnitrophica bacterium]|nr:tRNA sulfurtransferase [Candidatus Omnitrophota bacterium]
MRRIKALGMISGGLDSTLATKVMIDMGIEVEGVNFSTGFCVTEHTRNFKSDKDKVLRPNEALRLSADLRFKLHIIDISKDYLPVVTNPKYGYGQNLNPCVDCRIFMFGHMKRLLAEYGADFMFTGEVLGQRPMSQHRLALKNIESDSGLAGLVVRPLSAGLLDPTIPEVKGWIDRDRMLALSGRSRKPQMQLARDKGLEDYPQPAGGCCYLTDPQYTAKLRDIFEHEGKANLTHEHVLMLKVGRHFRVSERIKVIVGRNELENNFLKLYTRGRHAFIIDDYPAALTLAEVRGVPDEAELGLLASIAARYSDAPQGQPVRVVHRYADLSCELHVPALADAQLEQWRV